MTKIGKNWEIIRIGFPSKIKNLLYRLWHWGSSPVSLQNIVSGITTIISMRQLKTFMDMAIKFPL